MRIILAPDSFKGSVTAAQACKAMRQGILRACPDAEIADIPMADGGEGTAEALVTATGGQMRSVSATGPLGESVTGQIGVLGDGRSAVLEMACVSGLPLVPPPKRNPLHTTTYGTGQLIAAAIDTGAETIIIGIGGSATTDLGCGMAQALGARFFDAAGREITQPMTGGLLEQVSHIDVAPLQRRLADCRCRFVAACDVTNPLLGATGSAAVYAPQKGATPEIVRKLEVNLTHAAGLMEQATGRKVRDIPGAGAAGGLGAGLMAFVGAELKKGIEIVLEASRFAERIAGADLILTGEGQIDSQTAYGKTISGVARAARAAGVPVIALAGSIASGAENLYGIGVTSMFSIVPGPMTLESAMTNAEKLLADASEQALRAFISRH